MSMKQDIRPVTWMKSNAAEMLDQVNQTHRPVIITQNGQPRAVVQDPESYEKMTATLAMLKLIAQGEQDIKAGRMVEQEAMFASLLAGKAKKRKPA